MIKASGLTNCLWVSDLIHIKSFFDDFKNKIPDEVKTLKSCGIENYDHKTITSIMGTSHTIKQFHELVSYCAEDKLDVPDEPCSFKVKRISFRQRLFDRTKRASNANLATLKHLQNNAEDGERTLKYSKTLFLNPSKKGKPDLEVKGDIVVSIKVHDTILPNTKCVTPCKSFSHEIMILGSQSLAALRDAIMCATDNQTTSKQTEKLIFNENESHTTAKDVFKSAFLFIEDVFYNDFRYVNNIDYSKVVMEWAKSKGFVPLETGSLTNTKIEDLKVRFGYPYAYVHQGNCEHIIVFSDASLLHESDACNASDYPLLKSVSTQRPQECMICCYSFARWITFNNDRVPVDPFFFCDECFKSYNYVNDKKIGDFQVYEYFPYFPLNFDK